MNSGDKLKYLGYEVLLYPLEYLNITADPNSPNHVVSGVSNSGLWDSGWYENPVRKLYAPCTMELVASYPTGTANGHTQMWRSINPVWIPSKNQPTYITIAVSHSSTLYYTSIGTVIAQGVHFYDTGTYGYASGSHVHFILSESYRTSMFPAGYNSYVGGNIWYSDHAPSTIADFFYLTGAETIINDWGLSWQQWKPKQTLKTIILYEQLFNRRKKHGTRIYT